MFFYSWPCLHRGPICSCQSFWHRFTYLCLLLPFCIVVMPLGIDGQTYRLICTWLLFVLCSSSLVWPVVPCLFALFCLFVCLFFSCTCFVKCLETLVTGALQELFYYYQNNQPSAQICSLSLYTKFNMTRNWPKSSIFESILATKIETCNCPPKMITYVPWVLVGMNTVCVFMSYIIHVVHFL